MSFGLVLGALGTIGGLIQNEKARKDAKAAQKKAGKLTDRQVALFDMLMGMVKDADARGQFDPARRLDQLRADTAEYESRDLGNLAGAMRVAGYRPGDSEIGGRLDAVKLKYRSEFNRLANDIHDQAWSNKLASYRAIDPTALNSAIQQANYSAANAQSQVQNPAAFLSALMPYLNQGGSGAAPASGGSAGRWSLPVAYGQSQNGATLPADDRPWALPNWNPRPRYGR